VILVFLPGSEYVRLGWKDLRPLAIAYIWAILASLLVALTVTPALSIALLGERDLPPQEPPAVRWLKRAYHGLLLRIEKAPGLVMAVVALLVALGIGTLFLLSESFLPELREGNITVHMTALPGAPFRNPCDSGTASLKRC